MADLFDNFTGSAGPLHGRVAPQGGTWSDSTGQCSISGGSVYTSGAAAVTNIPVNSNLPGTDCACSVVIGAGYTADSTHTAAPSVAVRVSGSGATQSYYLYQLQWNAGPVQDLVVFRIVGGVLSAVSGAIGLHVTVAANDVWTFTASGSGASIALNAYRNGTLVVAWTDTEPARLTTGNGIGLVIGAVAGQTDMIRALWAGPWVSGVTGPPAITIAPATPTVSVSGTQPFTATTAFTGESFAWSASAGTISGTLATETWTAPGSGTSETITGASIDLPGRTATATATLTATGATAFTVTGPSSGYKANASTAFTFTPTGGSYSGTISFTMPGLAGTWTPTSRTWAASSAGQTATFTPSAVGTGTVTGTGAPVLTQSSSPSYTSNPQTLGVTPGALPTSATTLEHFYGGGTLWLATAPTFTPSGSVAGVTCGAVTVISDTEARADITTGTATGTFLWTDSTTGATASEVVATIVNVLSIGEGFATGLSTVGYAVYDAAGATISAWTTSGVAERGSASGDYGAVVALAQDSNDYEIRWSQTSGTTPPFVHDIRRAMAASSGTGTAATAAQNAAAVWRDATAGDFTVTGSIGKYIMTGVTINLAQSGFTPRNLGTVADAALTVGDALMAAICAAAGKESITGTSYVVKTPTTGTTIRSFVLDSATAPSSRELI